MFKKKIKPRDCHSQKPLHLPNMTTSLRTIIDRQAQGLAINAEMREHIPLTPDGDDMDDYDKGTEEYNDLVDIQHLSERIQEAKEQQQKRVDDARENQRKDDFNKAVEEEIQRRSAPPATE